jgi:hypothetical protein
LIICYNPLLDEERARKRQDLLAATERELQKVEAATQRAAALTGKENRAARGQGARALQMGKHFEIEISDTSFRWQRKDEQIEIEQSLMALRHSHQPERQQMSSEKVVESYKRLSGVEQAFRV